MQIWLTSFHFPSQSTLEEIQIQARQGKLQNNTKEQLSHQQGVWDMESVSHRKLFWKLSGQMGWPTTVMIDSRPLNFSQFYFFQLWVYSFNPYSCNFVKIIIMKNINCLYPTFRSPPRKKHVVIDRQNIWIIISVPSHFFNSLVRNPIRWKECNLLHLYSAKFLRPKKCVTKYYSDEEPHSLLRTLSSSSSFSKW